MSQQKPFSRTVQNLGNGCLGVSIPPGAADAMDIESGDELGVGFDWEKKEITFRSK